MLNYDNIKYVIITYMNKVRILADIAKKKITTDGDGKQERAINDRNNRCGNREE